MINGENHHNTTFKLINDFITTKVVFYNICPECIGFSVIFNCFFLTKYDQSMILFMAKYDKVPHGKNQGQLISNVLKPLLSTSWVYMYAYLYFIAKKSKYTGQRFAGLT